MKPEAHRSPGDTSPPLRILLESLARLESRDERERFLDFTCREDPGLRARLERMLARQEEADGLFEIRKPPDTDESAPGPEGAEGTRIGRYLLLGRLGEGGCGVVYLAEQQEPVKRKVALKIIRLGMDTENVIARFNAERQALAMMDHPNIARVLDAGATRSGRPYFVMQLVDGEKITAYCDAHRLGIPERLRLFTRICHAVQHAHQKGIIHRDIKPSNVLIWEDGGELVPKVIDFGIAKATGSSFPQAATFTLDGQLVGTPAYMSPEQATGAGLDVDTRTDIYSLGALLYELLTGHPPFDPDDFHDTGVEEIRATLRNVEPPPPSAAITRLSAPRRRETADLRGMDARRLAPDLDGDLDRIVMKAMAKDRQRRYSGADALATDIRCHLNDEPVSARPPGNLYRLGKLIRRNKVTFAAGALVFASLLIGLGAATVMSLRATRAREAAETARADEAKLRHAAEIAANISRAAVLVKYGRFEEADRLLEDVPPALAIPSLESADTFRSLGFWHAREGHWQKAADRFAGLAYALSSADETDSDAVSLNLQPAAAALCEAGDEEGYEALRRMAVERFGNTTNPVVAEQILKACLLRPAPPALLERLAPLESLMLEFEDTADGRPPDDNLVAWRRFAIGLMEYRKGTLNTALDHLDAALGVPNQNAAREAIVRLLRAMAWERQNRHSEAEKELLAARAILEERFASEPSIFDQWEPVWQDWINARILMREAQARLKPRGGPASDRHPATDAP